MLGRMRIAILLAIGTACDASTSASSDADVDAQNAADTKPRRILLYTLASGFRHDDALGEALRVLPPRLATLGIASEMTSRRADLESENLARFDAVMFLYTSGDVMNDTTRVAMEQFITNGGGWMGIHSATNTEQEWPFFQELVVTRFLNHPAPQPAILDIEDRWHPATVSLPQGRWSATDEWHNFQWSPRVDGVHILITIDETTYTGGRMGADHPMVWTHERFGSRALFSDFGHVPARWIEPEYVDHIVGGVKWVVRAE
jgi:type 1 glutamine amidotransferase